MFHAASCWDLSQARDWAELVFYVVSSIAAIWALYTYRRSARTRRAEWLLALFKGFFEHEQHKRMRNLLDVKPDQDYAALCACITNDRFSPDIDALDEYLNFFDFIAQLEQLRQLKLGEIDKLFHYYLDNLASQPILREYISAKRV